MAEFLLNLVTNQYDDAISINETRPPRFLHWREGERLNEQGIYEYYPEN